ncbi:MAG TPA: TIGR03790 family protein, partial [Vicinamibacterales bacterium]
SGAPRAIVAVMLMATAGQAAAQGPANVLVVSNDRSATSTEIAREYVRRRAVPDSNVCRISAPTTETTTRGAYESTIEQPIWNCIARHHAEDRILYIVLTKDGPIRIAGTAGRGGTVASVDSELTLLYRRRSGRPVPLPGFVPNPYFAGSAHASAAFTHAKYDIYLVTRLDGYTVDDVRGLIERGAAPARQGFFVLDGRASLVDPDGNGWLRTAAERLRAMGLGDRVVLDESAKVLTHVDDVLGYYSWGSNDSAIRIRDFGMKFVPGALAAEFVSSDARTFTEPPASWMPGSDSDPARRFAGTPQSLIGDFIHAGVTGTAGHVNEPYLEATIRPDILFPAYAAGANLAEAFYAAMPYLSWQTVVIGDPLCAPLRKASLTDAQIDPGIDPATTLPRLFSERRIAAAGASVHAAAVAFAHAQALAETNDAPGARKALAEALAAEPHFTGARMWLALAADADRQFDDAIAQYRAILAYEPDNALALNNLAYSLGVNKHAPADALPLAQRAVTASHDNPAMLDTLAWTEHLLGQDGEALGPIAGARDGAPRDPEVRLHAAAIYAALKDLPRASNELAIALKLNPALANRADVQALARRLRAGRGR